MRPIVVDLGLVRAFDGQRDRFVECERRSAVEADERCAVEDEPAGEDLPAHPREVFVEGFVGIAFDGEDGRIREDGAVELHGLLGAIRKPQARNDRY